MRPRAARRSFKLAALGLAAAALLQGAFVGLARRRGRVETERGSAVDRLRDAWVASFLEAGRLPTLRPRDSMGDQLATVPDPFTGWRYRALTTGTVRIDAAGLQQVGGAGRLVLVTGGSVAAGSGATDEARTWWAIAAQRSARGVVVAAAGAWKSSQELAALRLHGPRLRPVTVVMMTGLNDVANDEPRVAPFGAAAVIANAAAARDAAAAWGGEVLVVLQPSPGEKSLTPREERVMLPGQFDRTRPAYAAVRAGLVGMRGVRFVDASAAFVGQATVFCDPWHFGDIGHDILGRRVAEALR